MKCFMPTGKNSLPGVEFAYDGLKLEMNYLPGIID